MEIPYYSLDQIESVLTFDRDDYGEHIILGEGGYGTIYRGTLQNGGKVAIKLMHQRPEAEAELRREFSLFHKLKHPHLVEYLLAFKTDIGDSTPMLGLVMNLIEGDDLQTVIDNIHLGAVFLTPGLFWQTACQVLKALKELHQEGLAHRDIKPENIMIEEEDIEKGKAGDIKVVDLGFACFLKQRVDFPEEYSCNRGNNRLAGSRAYMSPELLRGEFTTSKFSSEIFKAADMWAFGLTLYQLLEGNGTFPARFGNNVETIAAIYPNDALLTDAEFPKTMHGRHDMRKAIVFVKELLHPDWRNRLKVDTALYSAEQVWAIEEELLLQTLLAAQQKTFKPQSSHAY